MKKLLAAATILLATTTLGHAQMVMKFAHPVPTTDLQHELAVAFAEQVAERSNGEMKVEIYPNSQLGIDQQMINGTRMGMIDFNMVGSASFNGVMGEIALFDLPFLFKNRDHAYAALDGEIGDAILAKLEPLGLKGLSWPENGFRNMTNNRGPITKVEDLSGLVMRTNNSVPLNAMFENLGANPQPMPYSELYTALETGVVTAQEHPINVTYSSKYYEVQKYLTIVEHSYTPLTITMNLAKYNAMSEEQRKVIEESIDYATDFQRKRSIEMEEQYIQALVDNGMVVNRDVDKDSFITSPAVTATWESFREEYGGELVDKIVALGKDF
ncbi:DctP family TRAP transporter solute-binding subunit [Rhodobacteraceae bacterium RKSG542]|uniref:DctP family TRAP transporter solute-binding subunit n=1 Tax=Pseudovibrio flavus TaxID=2529854 RepID=UPI0012BCEBAB|nr:DctP family TRAP transporter solute-binding subunit [Pseudovibrio flavus]MTI18117.1 DctP family TRAP transporter solute-binding subunit [Pseudovibrio flavus]